MTDRIVTLVDNCVYGRNLKAEHGLSLYIELGGKKILFDTGSTDLFIQNAHQLNIDLREVDYLVLSHGHSDHTGGLHAFLSYNQKAKVVCKRGILDRKFKGPRENGMKDISKLDLTRFIFVKHLIELVPGIFIFTDLQIANQEDTHFDHFDIVRNGERIPDTFDEELALAIVKGNEMTILSACSHRGITNILTSILSVFHEKHLSMVIGGYHIHLAGPEKSNLIADYFQHYPDCKVGVCHCTGVDQYARLCARLGERVFYNHVGLQHSI